MKITYNKKKYRMLLSHFDLLFYIPITFMIMQATATLLQQVLPGYKVTQSLHFLDLNAMQGCSMKLVFLNDKITTLIQVVLGYYYFIVHCYAVVHPYKMVVVIIISLYTPTPL